MPLYRLRGAVRRDDGEIGEPELDQAFEAADRNEALRIARNRAFEGYEATINAVWLTDAENNALWSLRVGDGP